MVRHRLYRKCPCTVAIIWPNRDHHQCHYHATISNCIWIRPRYYVIRMERVVFAYNYIQRRRPASSNNANRCWRVKYYLVTHVRMWLVIWALQIASSINPKIKWKSIHRAHIVALKPNVVISFLTILHLALMYYLMHELNAVERLSFTQTIPAITISTCIIVANSSYSWPLISECNSFYIVYEMIWSVSKADKLADYEFLFLIDRNQCDDSSEHVAISAYSKWDSVSSRVAPSERPVVLHRAGTTNTANPFGSTFCYGYQDIIFEVSITFTTYQIKFGIRNGINRRVFNWIYLEN